MYPQPVVLNRFLTLVATGKDQAERDGLAGAARLYKLEQKDGTPVVPPRLRNAIPRGHHPLGRDKTLRVIDTSPGSEPDDDWVLVVEAA